MGTENVDIVVKQEGANEAANGYTLMANAAEVAAGFVEGAANALKDAGAAHRLFAEAAIEAAGGSAQASFAADASAQSFQAAGAAANAEASGHENAKHGADSHSEAVTKAGEAAEHAAIIFEKFKQTLELLGIGLAVKELIEYAEGWEKVNIALLQVTNSQHGLEEATHKLFDIANQTRTGIQATAELYSTFAKATRDLTVDHDQLYTVVKTLQASLIANGQAAGDGGQAFRQLALGLATGTVEARGFHTIMLTNLPLARAIADNWRDGAGVTVEALKQMVAAGQVTSKELLDAITRASTSIQAQAARMPVTIGQAFTVLSNNILKFIGEANEGISATGLLAGGVLFLSNHLTALATIVGLVVGYFVLMKGIALAAWFIEAATAATLFAAANIAIIAPVIAITALLAGAAYLALIAYSGGIDKANQKLKEIGAGAKDLATHGFGELTESMKKVGETASGSMADPFKTKVNEMNQSLQGFSKNVGQTADTSKVQMAPVFKWISDPVEKGVDAADEALKKLQAEFGKTASTAQTDFSSVDKSISSKSSSSGDSSGGAPSGGGGIGGFSVGGIGDGSYGLGLNAVAQAEAFSGGLNVISKENKLLLFESVYRAASGREPDPATLPRFALGGAFDVGGSGATDSQLVQFLATPGERVTVQTPAQQRGGSSGRPIQVVMHIQTPDANSFNRSKTQILQQLKNGLANVK